MTISDIVTILQNQLTQLAYTRGLAVQTGDLATVVQCDASSAETQATLASLQSIPDAQ